MADLKQALIWLAEGKKIARYGWSGEYIHFYDGLIRDEENLRVPHLLSYKNDWELYEEPKPCPKPEWDEREVRLRSPVKNGEDYVVWDKNGSVTIAFWCSDLKCFYDHGSHAFALDVVEYKPLPKRDGE